MNMMAKRRTMSKTIEEAADGAWVDYCFRANGSLCSTVFKDAFKMGAQFAALSHQWRRPRV